MAVALFELERRNHDARKHQPPAKATQEGARQKLAERKSKNNCCDASHGRDQKHLALNLRHGHDGLFITHTVCAVGIFQHHAEHVDAQYIDQKTEGEMNDATHSELSGDQHHRQQTGAENHAAEHFHNARHRRRVQQVQSDACVAHAGHEQIHGFYSGIFFDGIECDGDGLIDFIHWFF